MKNAIFNLRILFIVGCICIALGVFMWGMRINYWYVILFWGIFMLGFWTFIMIVNPELKDYGEERKVLRG